MRTSGNLGSPFWREKQLVLSERWSTNDLVRKYRLKQYNQCGCKIGIDINSLDYHKTLLDRFHSKTPNFFTELKHGKKKKERKLKRKKIFRKRKLRLGYFTISWWQSNSSLFLFAESVLLFLVGEALQQRNLFSNCKNHFRKRSTWAPVQLCGYCYFGVSTDK